MQSRGGLRRARRRGEGSPHLSSPPGASGEEEEDEVALDGDESGAGPEEERPDAPEGEG